MDVVSDVLRVTGVRGTLGARVEAGGRWAVAGEEGSAAGLHAITAGEAWLTPAEHPPLRLRAGDVVLLAAGVRYVLGDAPGSPVTACDPAELTRSRRTGQPVRFGTEAPDTRIITIAYDCDPTVRTQLLFALPELMHVRGGTGADGLDGTVRMLHDELAHPQLATTAVLASLVDIVLIQVLRAWLPTRAGERRGTWLGMMGDPVVHRALQHLHADPARRWTTEALAAAVAVSRSTLTRRFPAAVGQGPATYLTQWRLDLAARRLTTTDQSVESIAAAVGYHSVPAFSRAFARSHGAAPGRYRTMRRRYDNVS
ncbi:AraC family transcriptional regulator [Micromonospora echinospora]|nr:AraC family transcriptional regulator [Micromonospora echinospora]OZV81822.1 AraC family transcriptional regulator [Micromonospora echinospora]